MARTIIEIKQELNGAYKEVFGLTTEQMDKVLAKQSNAGGWAMLSHLFAMAVYTLEKMFDLFTKNVADMASNVEVGKKNWWQKTLLAFQYGDTLLEKDGKFYYQKIDPSKQIINRCSVDEVDGLVQFKIAHLNGTVLEKISDSNERTAIESYIKVLKPSGVKHQVISNDADKLNFTIRFLYDGKLIRSVFEIAVKAAIKSYLNNISLNDLDGLFRPNELRKQLLELPGMVDVFIVAANKQVAGSTVWSDLSLIENSQSLSGYYSFDELSSILTYEPQ